jgi:hypothetical protein
MWEGRLTGEKDRGELTLAVRTALLQEENSSALAGQELANIAVDVLLLLALGLAAGADVGLDCTVGRNVRQCSCVTSVTYL